MTRRKVRPDELDLWNKVTQSATPLEQRAAPRLDELKPSNKAPNPAPQPIQQFRIGQHHPSKNETHLPFTTLSESLSQSPVHMDAKAFKRMRGGKLTPEARLDLHGRTVDQAHGELIRFILTSHARDLRLVLVITGKGQRHDPFSAAPMRRGVLKHQVPAWLRMPPLAQSVLQVSESHKRHGGAGAYYVYLKRRR